MNSPELTYDAIVSGGTEITKPNDVNTQYSPAPIVT